ncbi:MAG TPA: hypothetical protein VGN17_13600 [Bryobacteraceae bacterium]|jgi:hypothetical protein
MPCTEWSNLLKRYQYAVHAYHEAMDRLNAEFGSGYTTAWQHAETARRRSCDCRNALLAHQRYHGCLEPSPVGRAAAPRYFVAAAGAGTGGTMIGSTEDMVLGDQGQAGG